MPACRHYVDCYVTIWTIVVMEFQHSYHGNKVLNVYHTLSVTCYGNCDHQLSYTL